MISRSFFGKHKVGLLLGSYLTFCLVSISISTRTVNIRPKEIGLSIFSLFQYGVSSVQEFVGSTVNSIRTLRDLKRDYEQAMERVRYFEKIEKQYTALEEENQQLKELLQFSQNLEYKNIPARIIGKDPQNYFSTITVNKGSLHGVRKNMPVIAIQGGKQGLVGKIIQTGFNSSTIQPIYDPSAYVAARLSQSRYEGLVNGSEEEKIFMHYVKRFARLNIHNGELVVTSGMNSIFPPGIPIGTLKAIHVREYDTSLELELEPIIDFGRLEYVYILQPIERAP
ncbi:MAG TPA: rod shape-determining protein MreC [Spirochaetales bacterium]|nr:rod shape-determining protein MreC [Spirochaetales bacterium]HOV37867.1 rod shape-determining protein MreC [Spirochaetales bacterium]